MALYKTNNGSLQTIKEDSFKLEKDIQTITEKNLEYIFGLKFIKTEFSLNNLRIDTLAFDNDSKSFVIIEYKRDKNFSVIDQWFAYLSLMLNNKADFILEYNESTDVSIKRDDIDWTQSRVMFISPTFSKYQQQAINFKDLPIELWEITKYQGDLIQYNRLKTPDASESINKISKSNEIVNKVAETIKVYTEEDHLKPVSEDIVSLYEEFKNQILNLGDKIEIKPKKQYIAFKSSSNFIDMIIQKRRIKFWLNVSKWKLNDIYNIGRDVSNIWHRGNGDYEFSLESSSDIANLIPLVKQSYDINK